jgi:uncharacterized DUF497 family protein
VVFNWDEAKNRRLKESRGISFEEIVIAIHEGSVLDVLEHPNTERYPGQRIYLIAHREYVWVVPFVRDSENEEIFLKTAYPSRRYTRDYLKREDSDGGQ